MNAKTSPAVSYAEESPVLSRHLQWWELVDQPSSEALHSTRYPHIKEQLMKTAGVRVQA